VKEEGGWDAKHGKSKAEIRGDMGKNCEGVVMVVVVVVVMHDEVYT
jgi:hypothetical protein